MRASLGLSASRQGLVGRDVVKQPLQMELRSVSPALTAQLSRNLRKLQAQLAPQTRLSVHSKVASVDAPKTETEAEVTFTDKPQLTSDMPELKNVGYPDAVVFQAFGWDSCHVKNWYEIVKSKAEDMKAAGFTHIWLPPPSSSPVSPQGYMPGKLYDLNSKYGNEQQLQDLNRTLLTHGLAPMADIVINHRCACEQSPDGTWNRFGDDLDHDGQRVDWDAWAITSDDPHFKGTGNPDTGEDFGPAPDLDHANPDLRKGLSHWLQYLHRGVGFAGWRLDYVKGYGAEFVKEYVDKSVTMDSVNIGEFWTDLHWEGADLAQNQDAARQRLCDWIDGNQRSAAAFDFPTKGILQEAVKHTQYYRLRDHAGKAPGLIGWWPKMAVTFVDNHDTGSSQAHWPFPNERIGVGYAYIITHPGIPCIFWEHFYDWGNDVKNTIKNLLDLRKRNGIRANSKLEILCAEHDMYVARIDDKVMVKLGPRYDMGDLSPKVEDGWVKAVKGPDFCVWEKAENAKTK